MYVQLVDDLLSNRCTTNRSCGVWVRTGKTGLLNYDSLSQGRFPGTVDRASSASAAAAAGDLRMQSVTSHCNEEAVVHDKNILR